jgi:hypothetical protein
MPDIKEYISLAIDKRASFMYLAARVAARVRVETSGVLDSTRVQVSMIAALASYLVVVVLCP